MQICGAKDEMKKLFYYYSFLIIISIAISFFSIGGGMFSFSSNNANDIYNLSNMLVNETERGKKDVLVEFDGVNENDLDRFIDISTRFNTHNYLDYSMFSVSNNNTAYVGQTNNNGFDVSISGFSYVYSNNEFYSHNVLENVYISEYNNDLTNLLDENTIQIIIPNNVADKILDSNDNFNDYNDIVNNNYQIRFNDIDDYTFVVSAIYNPSRQSRFNWFYKDSSFGDVILVNSVALNAFNNKNIRYFFSFNEDPTTSMSNVGFLESFSNKFIYPDLEVNQDFASSGKTLAECFEDIHKQLTSPIYISVGIIFLVIAVFLFLISLIYTNKVVDFIFTKFNNYNKRVLYAIISLLFLTIPALFFNFCIRTFLPLFTLGSVSMQTITSFSFWAQVIVLLIILLNGLVTFLRYKDTFDILAYARHRKENNHFINYCFGYDSFDKNNDLKEKHSNLGSYKTISTRKKMILIASGSNNDIGAAGTRVNSLVDIIASINELEALVYLKSNEYKKSEIIRQGDNFKVISIGGEEKKSKLSKLIDTRIDEFKHIFEDEKPDIVYVYSTINPFLAMFVKKYCLTNKIKLYFDVVEFRKFSLPFISKSYSYNIQNYFINHFIIDKNISGVFCCSTLLIKYFKNKKKIENICYLPILSCENKLHEIPKKTNKVTYLFVGSYLDDINEIILAFNMLDDKILKVVRLIVCGIDAHNIIFSKHLAPEQFKKSLSYTIYLGKVPLKKVFALLSCSDYTVIKLKKHSKLSNYGFASRIPQSFSYGLPVICTAPGDTSIYVKNNVNGYIAENESINAYSKAIYESIKNHHANYDKLSKAAYETFLSLKPSCFVKKMSDFILLDDKEKENIDFTNFTYMINNKESNNHE